METREAIEAFAFGDALAAIIRRHVTSVVLVNKTIPALKELFRSSHVCRTTERINRIIRMLTHGDCARDEQRNKLDEQRNKLNKILHDVDLACQLLIREEYYHTLLPEPHLVDITTVIEYSTQRWASMGIPFQVHLMLRASSAAEEAAPRGGGEVEATVVPPHKRAYVPPHKRA